MLARSRHPFSYPAYRTFGGKRYRFQGSTDTKRGAVATKKLLQDDGMMVRVVSSKVGGFYLIYGRR